MKIISLINKVLPILLESEQKYPNDKTYAMIARQLEFLKDCIENNKSLKDELKGRELNFNVIASKNFSGPEEDLQKKVSEIAVLLSKTWSAIEPTRILNTWPNSTGPMWKNSGDVQIQANNAAKNAVTVAN